MMSECASSSYHWMQDEGGMSGALASIYIMRWKHELSRLALSLLLAAVLLHTPWEFDR